MPVLVIDKPLGLTSFAVVKSVARLLRRYRAAGGRGMPDPKRIGHGGTLDPMATGVLPVCVGEATKLAPFLLDADKAYEAVMKLGVHTDTLDAEGQVLHTRAVPRLSAGEIEATLARFVGPQHQVPPMYAALKHQGKPLYAYAREGQEIERQPRALTIFELVLQRFEPPDVVGFSVRCSKGTYVRVLASDLGNALGTCAHLVGLRRTLSGPFSLAQAMTLAELEARAEASESLPIVSLAEALRHHPQVALTAVLVDRVTKGQKLPWSEVDPEGALGHGHVALLRPDGSLVAVASRAVDGMASFHRVFNPEVV